jgi:hypothetical protein
MKTNTPYSWLTSKSRYRGNHREHHNQRLSTPILLLVSLLLAGLLFIISGCGAKSQDGLVIYVIEAETLLNPSEEIAAAFDEDDLSALTNNDLAKADIVITEEDILTYDWKTQKIVLSNTFRKPYTDDSFSSNPLSAPLSPFSAFIVSFNGEPLFSGTVLPIVTATWYETPVLYVDDFSIISDEDGLVLYLRPSTMIIGREDNLDTVFPIVDQELAEEIRQHFEANGK